MALRDDFRARDTGGAGTTQLLRLKQVLQIGESVDALDFSLCVRDRLAVIYLLWVLTGKKGPKIHDKSTIGRAPSSPSCRNIGDVSGVQRKLYCTAVVAW